MTKPAPVHTRFRCLRAAVLAALVMGHSSLVIGAAPSALVAAIQSTRTTDLILLDRGFDAGLRQGMVCRITRGAAEIAEVLLVELRPSCCAALILNVSSRQSIRAGDFASIKILKS